MIGIFGGTFDPVHCGHLRAALDCQHGLGLREVRMLPLSFAVHRAQPLAPPALRLAMLRAAIADDPALVLDEREVHRGGPSYTVETLCSLRAELGAEMPLCLLVGADAFCGFMDWLRPLEILTLAHLVVMQRPGAPMARDAGLRDLLRERRAEQTAALRGAPAGRILFHRVTQIDISSSRIRAMLASGQSPRFLLPDAVLALAVGSDCYRAGQIPDGAPAAPSPVAARPITPSPVTSSPVTSSPVTSSPVTSSLTTPSPATPRPTPT